MVTISLSPVQPIPIDKIISELRRSTNRDEVVRLACYGVVSAARSAVFLARRKDFLKGWDGVGVSLSRDSVRNLWLPLSSPSLFRDVVTSTQPYYGSPHFSAIDVLFQAIVQSHGGEMMIRPVLLQERLVALICADGVSSGDIARKCIETISGEVNSAFAKLLAANKP
ncbi:MAG: hypothetical protein JXA30_20780 [Deltaproteobacteria bacterium]|nr:hypothetical protein [Deltaproteobacteria bacterium]